MSNHEHNLEDTAYELLIEEGIAEVKGGNKEQARNLLNKAAAYHRPDARPWIWLSATTNDPQEQRRFLEYAVASEPSNAAARRGLILVSDQLDKSRLIEEGQGVEPSASPEPQEAAGDAFLCPQCGGRLRFDPREGSLRCEYCSYFRLANIQYQGERAEQVMDFALPTTRGHRWAELQQRFSCDRCGAVALLPPGQKTTQCPYCGSNQLVLSQEATELVDPQAIGLFKIDSKDAAAQAKKWLGAGWLSPDDIGKGAKTLYLRSAYYPFWTFDGTLEVDWSCEVNEGTSRNPSWAPRSGTEFDLFDDVLAQGFNGLPVDLVARVEPFDLKGLAEFQPEYLAGWLALGYNRSLADASLLAREQVVRSLRRSLDERICPGQQKRNLNLGAGQWSGQTYKHVLLPLWVGNYTYRDKTYPVLINGQTGKIAGEKPRDPMKIVLYVSLFLAITIILFVLLWMLSAK